MSDSSLGKTSADQTAFRGTHLYCAPEVYATRRPEYYTHAWDMWSLGGIVYKYDSSPLLNIDKNNVGLAWCKELIRRSWDWDSAVSLNLLSTAMLSTEPERRIPTS